MHKTGINGIPADMLDAIITGDNVVVMRRLPNNCITLCVTSPPYDDLRLYDGYIWNFKEVAAELWRLIMPGGVLVWVVADATVEGSETGTSFRQALYFLELGFNMETMIYEQTGTGAKGSNHYYWQSFEFMFVFSKGRPQYGELLHDQRNLHGGEITAGERLSVGGTKKPARKRRVPMYSKRGNIWRITPDRLDNHPAPFPEALAHDHILSWSSPGDVVMDCFSGSGTTAKMAVATGRHFIGIDVSEDYNQMARRRVAEQLESNIDTWERGRGKPGHIVDTAELPLWRSADDPSNS